VQEPISLSVRARGFYDGARIVAREGGSDGPILCVIPIRHTPGENVYYTEYLERPISGIKDITFTFEDPDEVDRWALCYFIDWQFNLPPIHSETLHTDIWNKTTPAAHFSFRNSASFWRQPSTDSGATTLVGREFQVGGITDGSKMIFGRSAFEVGGGATLTIRAQTLAGGYIEVYANRGFKIWNDQWTTMPLGVLAINGTQGAWEEFVLEIPEDVLSHVNFGGSYTPNGVELMFRFVSNGHSAPGEELFAISEFTFIR
jgi:hypothetical protein